MSETTYADRVQDDPWGLVIEALGYTNRDEVPPDDLQDAVSEAVAQLTAVTMMRAVGVEDETDPGFDQIMRQFEEREWKVKIAYDFDKEELSASVLWDHGDGEVVTATSRHKEGNDERDTSDTDGSVRAPAS